MAELLGLLDGTCHCGGGWARWPGATTPSRSRPAGSTGSGSRASGSPMDRAAWSSDRPPRSRSPWPAARPGTSSSNAASAMRSALRPGHRGPTCSPGSASTSHTHRAGAGRRSPMARTRCSSARWAPPWRRAPSPWVMTCVKHFALNSMEHARFTVDVRWPRTSCARCICRTSGSVVEAGADAVMSAYNSVNGEWAGQNRHLLTDILRDQWGFEGFVMTDFVWGLRAPVESVAAGQDLEMPFRQQRAATLPKALRDGRLQRSDVRRAAHRLLTAQVQLALRARPTPPPTVVACPAHRALAHEAAGEGSCPAAQRRRRRPAGAAAGRHRADRGTRCAGRRGQPGRRRVIRGAPTRGGVDTGRPARTPGRPRHPCRPPTTVPDPWLPRRPRMPL